MAEGKKAGMRGTPTFFLGYTDKESQKIKAIKMLRGAQPYARFKETLDGLLAAKEPAK